MLCTLQNILRTKYPPYRFDMFVLLSKISVRGTVHHTLHISLLFLFTILPYIISIWLLPHVVYGVFSPLTSDLFMVEHGSGWRLGCKCCGARGTNCTRWTEGSVWMEVWFEQKVLTQLKWLCYFHKFLYGFFLVTL